MGRIKKLFRMLTRYPLRLFNKISFRATVVDSGVDKTAVIEHHANAILEMAYGKANGFTGGREYTLENASREKCTARYVETIKSVLGK